jgi:arabinose-5-phosphate isomerase
VQVTVQRLKPNVQVGAQQIIDRGREVVRIEAQALAALEAALDDRFVAACHAIYNCRRQLVVTGMGKSGLIARKVAATFAATGTPAAFLHPGEAAHGDMGMLGREDVLLVLSNSGNTSELLPVLNFAKASGITVIGAASRDNSPVIELADIALPIPHMREACPVNVAPTTSTTMQLALGDALAMAVMDLRGIDRDHLRTLHPAGSIGLSLTPLGELMHGVDKLPLVQLDTGMPEAISVITSGCFGIAGVIDEAGDMVGIITDGDLRRRFGVLDTARASEVMTGAPKVLPPDIAAGDALAFLNDNQITAAFVVADPAAGAQPPIGIIHIHDLLRHGLS